MQKVQRGESRSRPAKTAAGRRGAAATTRAMATLSDRQRQIYLEASRLFVEKGFDATSMSDIADAVKMTKAGVYHFIESKEDLLYAIISFGMDELEEEVVEPARLVSDPLDRLKLVIRNHLINIGRVDSRSGNPVTIVVDESAGLSPQLRKIIDKRKRAYFSMLRDTVKELIADGRAPKTLDPSVAAHCIAGQILWMARWRRPGGRLTLPQIIEQITQIVLGGVVGRPGKS